MTLPGLRAARAASLPGKCICCGRDSIPLSSKPSAVAKRFRTSGSKRTHQDICGRRECHALRNTLWYRDLRADERAVDSRAA